MRQFSHPLALLWVAAALAVVGGNTTLAIAIGAVIVINAVLAFFQEVQASRATEALREFLPPHTRVRRDGEVAEVEATRFSCRAMVVLIDEGDRLSADARLISGGIEVDMSPLTGESQPVAREATAMDAPKDCSTRRTSYSAGRCAPGERPRRSSTPPE